MRFFGKKADGVIDGLLRAEFRRAADRSPGCTGFDADIATAYLEGMLTAAEAARYQSHMAGCGPCRMTVTELHVELNPSDARIVSSRVSRITGYGPFGAFFAHPRFAVAAACVLVIGISALWMINRPGARNSEVAPGQLAQSQSPAELDEQESALIDKSAPEQSPSRKIARSNYDSASNAQAGTAAAIPDQTLAKEQETAGKDQVAQVTGQQPVQESRLEQQSKADDRTEAANRAAQLGSRTQNPSEQSQAASPSAQSPAELGRIDQRKALSLSMEGSSAESKVIRPPSVSDRPGNEREKAGTIQPGNVIAKKSEANAEPSGPKRGVASSSPGSSSEEKQPSADARRGRASESNLADKETARRRVGTKSFRLVNGTWIDKDYRPEKEIPAITLVRDSDLYNEQLAKHPGLKSLVSGFTANEAVIVVYKNIAFKIMPADQGHR